MLEIDGSERSGSGTIVRDCIGFSVLKKKGLHLMNIRTNRDKPGLRSQHLKTLQACADICGGSFTGGQIGSKEIAFAPGTGIKGGEFRWDIGTAGSAIMLGMTILLPSLFAQRASRYVVTGGLFQDFAPSAFYFQEVVVPILKRMGAEVDLKILRPGYVPQGGGVIEIKVQPVREALKAIVMQTQGKVARVDGVALASFLKERRVAERIAAECSRALGERGYPSKVQVVNDAKENPAYRTASVQAGAALAIWAETDAHCIIGSDMAGARGRSAELIGKTTAENFLADLDSGATVDRYLADQLIPFAALADGWSSFAVPRVTAHVDTRLWLAGEILGAESRVEGNIVKIKGIGYRK